MHVHLCKYFLCDIKKQNSALFGNAVLLIILTYCSAHIAFWGYEVKYIWTSFFGIQSVCFSQNTLKYHQYCQPRLTPFYNNRKTMCHGVFPVPIRVIVWCSFTAERCVAVYIQRVKHFVSATGITERLGSYLCLCFFNDSVQISGLCWGTS